MALFKVFRGKRTDLDQVNKTDGHAYFCTDDGSFWIDYTDEEGQLKRKQVNEEDLKSKSSNLENGAEIGTIEIKDIEQESYITPGGIASGIGAVALTGQRGDKDPSTLDPTDDRISEASGLQSFVQGPGNLAAGDWSFVTGKDNIVYGNRAFVSGGANKIQKKDSNGNLLEEKTNVGRFNAVFGNNNEFYSANENSQSNLITGGSNIIDSGSGVVERNIIGGYNNKLKKDDTVRTDAKQFNIIGGQQNELKGAAGNDIIGGYNNSIQGTNTSVIEGSNNVITYLSDSIVIGKGLSAEKPYIEGTPDPITVFGQYNDKDIEDKVFVIGGGTSDSDRSNVFEIYNDGVVKTEQGTLSTESYVQDYVGGKITETTNWVNDKFTNYKPLKLNIGTNNTDTDSNNSLTVGRHSLNRGYQSAAIGFDAYVGYDSSGNATSKTPTGAVALNWSRANADYGLSACYDTEVNHSYSVALNNKTKTGASAQTVIGSYNAAKTTTAFEVGNGTSNNDRKNAFEVLKTGGFNSYGDSTVDGQLETTGNIKISGGSKIYANMYQNDGSYQYKDITAIEFEPHRVGHMFYINVGGQLNPTRSFSLGDASHRWYSAHINNLNTNKIEARLLNIESVSCTNQLTLPNSPTSPEKYTDTSTYSNRIACNGEYSLVDGDVAVVEKIQGNTIASGNDFLNTEFKGIKINGKNIVYTIEDRTPITVDKNSDLTVTNWHFREDGFYLGTSGTDSVYDDRITSYSFNGNSISASCVSSFYGIGLPIKVKGGESITVSFENLSANTRVSYRQFIDSTTPNGSQSAKTTSPFSIKLYADTEWLLLTIQPTAANVDISVSNIQIEYGKTATDFEPYNQKNTEFTFDDYIELGKYDYLLPQENKIVRKTKTTIMNGTNVIWAHSDAVGIQLDDFDISMGSSGIILNENYVFTSYPTESGQYGIEDNKIIFSPPEGVIGNAAIDYFNNNPITIVYLSTEEIVENIDCPKLYTIYNGRSEIIDNNNPDAMPTITTTYSIIENPTEVPNKAYVRNGLATKLDKIGGTITGDLVIEGKTNLALGALVSKKGDTTYGLTYDGESFKLGEGTLGENGFTFNEGEGLPIALRSDSSNFTNGNLVSWNSSNNSLVDSGVSVLDIKESVGYKHGIRPHTTTQGKNANKISFVTAATWNSYIVYLTMRNSEGGFFLSQVFCCNGVGTVSGSNNEELITLYDESTKTYTIQGPQVMNEDGWYDNTIIAASVLKID